MQKWMISAYAKIYDHAFAFEKWGVLIEDSMQNMKLEILCISIVHVLIRE